MLTTIRFPVKFHIGLYMSDHGVDGGNSFIPSRIELPGNQVKNFISLDSASLTESESYLDYKKSSQEKKCFSEFNLVIP